jgi:multidrug resistance efflux pump
MTELMKLIQDADLASVDVERAREAVESAKASLEAAKENFEQAKTQFDQTLMRADEMGVPRAKLKKLAEERTTVLVSSGLISTASQEARHPIPKSVKPAKKKTKSEAEVPPSESDADEVFDVISKTDFADRAEETYLDA